MDWNQPIFPISEVIFTLKYALCNSKNLAISLLFISQRAVKAQIIAKIMEKMMSIEKKYNFIDFLIKFNFIDFFQYFGYIFRKNL